MPPRARISSWLRSSDDRGNLNLRIALEPGDFNGGAGRRRIFEVRRISLVHFGEVIHVFEEDNG